MAVPLTKGQTLSLLFAIVSVATGAFLPKPSEAAIHSVHVGTTTWAPNSETARTPLFRNGGNTIVVIGDLPLMTAERFELRQNCNPVGLSTGPALLTVGSIKERTTQPGTLPKDKLVLSLLLTPTHPIGNFCGHLTYPAGNLTRSTFTVRVFHREIVTAMQVLVNGASVTSVPSGVPVQVRYTGSFFGRTTSSNLIQTNYILGPVSANNATTFTATATFPRCGPVTLIPQDIFDNAAPDAVLSAFPETRYRGGVKLPISVVAGPGGCPSAQAAPSNLGTFNADPNCGDPGQPACPTGPAATRR